MKRFFSYFLALAAAIIFVLVAAVGAPTLASAADLEKAVSGHAHSAAPIGSTAWQDPTDSPSPEGARDGHLHNDMSACGSTAGHCNNAALGLAKDSTADDLRWDARVILVPGRFIRHRSPDVETPPPRA